MRTPRPHSRPNRNIGTLIGNGWLRESPRNVIPREWNVMSRSALRKCMFMQMPAHLQELAAQLPAPGPPPVVQAYKRPEDKPVQRHARNPARDVRMMPAVSPQMIRANAESSRGRAWWEDPVALGTLLIVVPPIGLTCLWTSKHYSSDARWALTVMSAILTCFACGITLALLFAR